jgi:putative oxidoreductase
MAKCWTTNRRHSRVDGSAPLSQAAVKKSGQRAHHKGFVPSPALSTNDVSDRAEISRRVGEPDAQERRMTQNAIVSQRIRASLVALWVAQVALALMFLMAGGSKLAGAPAMVTLFDALGAGQWFRYVTGVIEVLSGLALLIPAVAVFGALLLIPTMIGAIIVNLFVVPASPVAPIVLLLLAAVVAWARRDQLRIS